MNNIPPELNQNINEIKVPERKVLIKVLIIAVMALSATVGFLFAAYVSGNKASKGDKDKINAECKEENKELKRSLFVKDSMLTASLIREAQKNNEDIFKEKMQIKEKSVTLKTQDSLLSLIKANR